jgi:hypothetical protein
MVDHVRAGARLELDLRRREAQVHGPRMTRRPAASANRPGSRDAVWDRLRSSRLGAPAQGGVEHRSERAQTPVSEERSLQRGDGTLGRDSRGTSPLN